MNFFKSVFSDDDPEPSDPQTAPTSPSNSQQSPHQQPDPNPDFPPAPTPSISSLTAAWSFGGMIKTLASKSESVLETYRRDLEEFGSGLKKETAVIREVAGRAVMDLPTSLEAGAAAAQESLESVGQAIDNLGVSVVEIISQGKDSLLDDGYTYSDGEHQLENDQNSSNLNSKPYSRIDAQIRAIQCDMNTYVKEVEDVEEFEEWKLGFKLGEKGGEIGDLIEENESIEEIFNEVVPGVVDEETFWGRYFYRVYKVKKAEEARAKLVKRAIAGEEEEVLSWDVDDDDYEESGGSKSKVEDLEMKIEERGSLGKVDDGFEAASEEKSLRSENDDEKEVVFEAKSDDGGDERVDLDGGESSGDKLEGKSDEKLGSDGKTENGGSCKDDFSIVSSQPSMPEEEDLGWDEIEDTGNTDEIKATTIGSPNRSDLRKRLTAMDEEEDLGWDIEDDDEPVKS
ncbi:hypothetical protein RHSIM_Rhsim02G0017100 [Rhododendron simsii]|uniref:BSD domain-containing protein n=1 Tax=Rhododendron simsii TaxID=118357 RepID=A0A834LY20_RHOSS|nr:hypothetical protein RHSIM_Rhsim02G0017100 [Rhododendron simsii]